MQVRILLHVLKLLLLNYDKPCMNFQLPVFLFVSLPKNNLSYLESDNSEIRISQSETSVQVSATSPVNKLGFVSGIT